MAVTRQKDHLVAMHSDVADGAAILINVILGINSFACAVELQV